MYNTENKDSGVSFLITLMLILLIVIIIISVSLPVIVDFMTEVEDSNITNLAMMEVQFTDNNNVIIEHTNGNKIDKDNIRIEIDGELSNIQFEEDVQKGDTLYIDKKPDGSEFEGGEKIDIIVGEGDSETVLISEILR